ncbi:MAG: hypothetical protein QOF54_1529 [Solirubrobacteraceae bacterium]|nr:hypothetical protein [Solirubrobacteraceae bacterium]
MPLLTGPLAGANFGVVVAFSEPGAGVEERCVVAGDLVLDDEPPEEPHAPSASSATHAIVVSGRAAI